MALTPRDTKGHLEESQAGELSASLQEKLKATQLAGELARQEMRTTLELVSAAGPRPVSLRVSRPPRPPHSAQPPAAPREEPGPGGVCGHAGQTGEGPE